MIICVPSLTQAPKTKYPIIPTMQLCGVFVWPSVSGKGFLQSHRGLYTTVFMGCVVLLMVSELTFLCKIGGVPISCCFYANEILLCGFYLQFREHTVIY